MKISSSKYVIITPANNEQSHISRLAEAVIAQTLLPERWIIVNDGSTDMTKEIARRYAATYKFITLINRKRSGRREFSSKAEAVNQAYATLGDCEFQFVGNLDADISFEPDYFERLIGKFFSLENLGIGGGICYDYDGITVKQMKFNLNSVRGAVQFFRRECFDQIHGYRSLRRGGIDSLAEFTALMNGWQVRTFQDLVVMHHRRTGAGLGGVTRSCFNRGRQDYSLGYRAVFEIARLLRRATEGPMIVGSLSILCGYFFGMITGDQIETPPDVLDYIRKEQLRKMLVARKWNRHQGKAPIG
jgi:poly-beta-1,6-N-acetyl-D-glucosamine synthase